MSGEDVEPNGNIFSHSGYIVSNTGTKIEEMMDGTDFSMWNLEGKLKPEVFEHLHDKQSVNNKEENLNDGDAQQQQNINEEISYEQLLNKNTYQNHMQQSNIGQQLLELEQQQNLGQQMNELGEQLGGPEMHQELSHQEMEQEQSHQEFEQDQSHQYSDQPDNDITRTDINSNNDIENSLQNLYSTSSEAFSYGGDFPASNTNESPSHSNGDVEMSTSDVLNPMSGSSNSRLLDLANIVSSASVESFYNAEEIGGNNSTENNIVSYASSDGYMHIANSNSVSQTFAYDTVNDEADLRNMDDRILTNDIQQSTNLPELSIGGGLDNLEMDLEDSGRQNTGSLVDYTKNYADLNTMDTPVPILNPAVMRNFSQPVVSSADVSRALAAEGLMGLFKGSESESLNNLLINSDGFSVSHSSMLQSTTDPQCNNRLSLAEQKFVSRSIHSSVDGSGLSNRQYNYSDNSFVNSLNVPNDRDVVRFQTASRITNPATHQIAQPTRNVNPPTYESIFSSTGGFMGNTRNAGSTGMGVGNTGSINSGQHVFNPNTVNRMPSTTSDSLRDLLIAAGRCRSAELGSNNSHIRDLLTRLNESTRQNSVAASRVNIGSQQSMNPLSTRVTQDYWGSSNAAVLRYLDTEEDPSNIEESEVPDFLQEEEIVENYSMPFTKPYDPARAAELAAAARAEAAARAAEAAAAEKAERELCDSLSVELQAAYKMLSQMMSDQLKATNYPFLRAVDSTEVGCEEYYIRIKKPMWLGKMKDKFRDGEYRSITEFILDMRLMFENCYRFNGIDSIISKRAQKLETILHQKVALLSKDLREKASSALSAGQVTEVVQFGTRRQKVVQALDSGALLDRLRREARERDREARRDKHIMRRAENEKLIAEVPMWEESLLQNGLDKQMKAMWELPSIGLFLYLCADPLRLMGQVTQCRLERCFAMPRESTTLRLIMTSLLSSANQRKNRTKDLMTYRVWNEALKNLVSYWYQVMHNKCKGSTSLAVQELGIEERFFQVAGQKRNPLLKKKFHELSFYQRVWIVKSLCEYLVTFQKSLSDAIELQPFEDRREYELGVDAEGFRYIHFPQFCGEDLRIYREIVRPPEEERTEKRRNEASSEVVKNKKSRLSSRRRRRTGGYYSNRRRGRGKLVSRKVSSSEQESDDDDDDDDGDDDDNDNNSDDNSTNEEEQEEDDDDDEDDDGTSDNDYKLRSTQRNKANAERQTRSLNKNLRSASSTSLSTMSEVSTKAGQRSRSSGRAAPARSSEGSSRKSLPEDLGSASAKKDEVESSEPVDLMMMMSGFPRRSLRKVIEESIKDAVPVKKKSKSRASKGGDSKSSPGQSKRVRNDSGMESKAAAEDKKEEKKAEMGRGKEDKEIENTKEDSTRKDLAENVEKSAAKENESASKTDQKEGKNESGSKRSESVAKSDQKDVEKDIADINEGKAAGNVSGTSRGRGRNKRRSKWTQERRDAYDRMIAERRGEGKGRGDGDHNGDTSYVVGEESKASSTAVVEERTGSESDVQEIYLDDAVERTVEVSYSSRGSSVKDESLGKVNGLDDDVKIGKEEEMKIKKEEQADTGNKGFDKKEENDSEIMRESEEGKFSAETIETGPESLANIKNNADAEDNLKKENVGISMENTDSIADDENSLGFPMEEEAKLGNQLEFSLDGNASGENPIESRQELGEDETPDGLIGVVGLENLVEGQEGAENSVESESEEEEEVLPDFESFEMVAESISDLKNLVDKIASQLETLESTPAKNQAVTARRSRAKPNPSDPEVKLKSVRQLHENMAALYAELAQYDSKLEDYAQKSKIAMRKEQEEYEEELEQESVVKTLQEESVSDSASFSNCFPGSVNSSSIGTPTRDQGGSSPAPPGEGLSPLATRSTRSGKAGVVATTGSKSRRSGMKRGAAFSSPIRGRLRLDEPPANQSSDNMLTDQSYSSSVTDIKKRSPRKPLTPAQLLELSQRRKLKRQQQKEQQILASQQLAQQNRQIDQNKDQLQQQARQQSLTSLLMAATRGAPQTSPTGNAGSSGRPGLIRIQVPNGAGYQYITVENLQKLLAANPNLAASLSAKLQAALSAGSRQQLVQQQQPGQQQQLGQQQLGQQQQFSQQLGQQRQQLAQQTQQVYQQQLGQQQLSQQQLNQQQLNQQQLLRQKLAQQQLLAQHRQQQAQQQQLSQQTLQLNQGQSAVTQNLLQQQLGLKVDQIPIRRQISLGQNTASGHMIGGVGVAGSGVGGVNTGMTAVRIPITSSSVAQLLMMAGAAQRDVQQTAAQAEPASFGLGSGQQNVAESLSAKLMSEGSAVQDQMILQGGQRVVQGLGLGVQNRGLVQEGQGLIQGQVQGQQNVQGHQLVQGQGFVQGQQIVQGQRFLSGEIQGQAENVAQQSQRLQLTNQQVQQLLGLRQQQQQVTQLTGTAGLQHGLQPGVAQVSNLGVPIGRTVSLGPQGVRTIHVTQEILESLSPADRQLLLQKLLRQQQQNQEVSEMGSAGVRGVMQGLNAGASVGNSGSLESLVQNNARLVTVPQQQTTLIQGRQISVPNQSLQAILQQLGVTNAQLITNPQQAGQQISIPVASNVLASKLGVINNQQTGQQLDLTNNTVQQLGFTNQYQATQQLAGQTRLAAASHVTSAAQQQPQQPSQVVSLLEQLAPNILSMIQGSTATTTVSSIMTSAAAGSVELSSLGSDASALMRAKYSSGMTVKELLGVINSGRVSAATTSVDTTASNSLASVSSSSHAVEELEASGSTADMLSDSDVANILADLSKAPSHVNKEPNPPSESKMSTYAAGNQAEEIEKTSPSSQLVTGVQNMIDISTSGTATMLRVVQRSVHSQLPVANECSDVMNDRVGLANEILADSSLGNSKVQQANKEVSTTSVILPGGIGILDNLIPAVTTSLSLTLPPTITIKVITSLTPPVQTHDVTKTTMVMKSPIPAAPRNPAEVLGGLGSSSAGSAVRSLSATLGSLGAESNQVVVGSLNATLGSLGAESVGTDHGSLSAKVLDPVSASVQRLIVTSSVNTGIVNVQSMGLVNKQIVVGPQVGLANSASLLSSIRVSGALVGSRPLGVQNVRGGGLVLLRQGSVRPAIQISQASNIIGGLVSQPSIVIGQVAQTGNLIGQVNQPSNVIGQINRSSNLIGCQPSSVSVLGGASAQKILVSSVGSVGLLGNPALRADTLRLSRPVIGQQLVVNQILKPQEAGLIAANQTIRKEVGVASASNSEQFAGENLQKLNATGKVIIQKVTDGRFQLVPASQLGQVRTGLAVPTGTLLVRSGPVNKAMPVPVSLSLATNNLSNPVSTGLLSASVISPVTSQPVLSGLQTEIPVSVSPKTIASTPRVGIPVLNNAALRMRLGTNGQIIAGIPGGFLIRTSQPLRQALRSSGATVNRFVSSAQTSVNSAPLTATTIDLRNLTPSAQTINSVNNNINSKSENEEIKNDATGEDCISSTCQSNSDVKISTNQDSVIDCGRSLSGAVQAGSNQLNWLAQAATALEDGNE